MSVLEDAREIVAQDPVCNACLGRVFADRSFGLTNEERGRALRTAFALADDEPYEAPEIGDCWVCEGYSGAFDALAERVVEKLEGVGFSTYQVGTRVSPLIEENERLLRESADLPADAGESFKSECNREVGKRVGRETDTEVDFERPDVLALCTIEGDGPESISAHAVDLQINPAFVYGRYRKLERDIPQTEWPCRECGGSGKQLGPDGEEPCEYCGGSGYLYDDSVEGYTVPAVVEAMDGEEGVFHGAGREDVDARMLESGRPFVIEVKHPRERDPDVAALEAEINERAAGSVEVEGLELATHEMVERVKGLDASKTYRMDVEFAEPVDPEAFERALEELDGTTIEQDTPQRVSHRRADLTRVREVYSIEGELHDPERAELTIHGAGGLYVKELVSGDEGRTDPSFAGLVGVESVVTALDVIDVRGEDEPFDDPDYLRE
ncbi:tRNA pseudouridine(54/55) synthase Pus10 [Halalkalicoccus sp. NIPERK01]|uniref:tRNA pseudouridine(54/55) synthase Pus10 n=1 Tax=Halalkalicoccus sp. NIPERK01 TaxID=3053469 RepID=UPI00256F3A27|nr:tRNA pseudouridine(54/55) synthase Pus10 [Halalkalicoccus sp. NIPERK01]MDL5362430.1 tRNA pseudouridine(54/55) synthase Pus10 [Halalkalicoccus sp. NIPERK01]